ncbi:MAG: glycerol-3-phosphate acyltransferase [Chloroflexia bacterium]
MLGLYLVLVTVVSYLIGAIPIGAVVAAYKKIDIAQHGSGKIGTTNVLRTVGRRAAAVVLVGDALKGIVAVLLTRWAEPLFVAGDGRLDLWGFQTSVLTVATLLASGAVVAGHVWSLYLRIVYGKWHGGRGVVTAMGAILIVNPWVILLAVLVGGTAIAISRYVSLGSIVGSVTAALAIVAWVAMGQMDVLSLLFTTIAVFVIAVHKDNIERLLKGTERKLGERARV